MKQELLFEMKRLKGFIVSSEQRVDRMALIGNNQGVQSEKRYIVRCKLRLAAIERELEELEIN